MRSDGSLHSRVSYDAYGRARYRADGDLNLDGVDFSTPDVQVAVASFGAINTADYLADADINRDGVVNSTDLAVLSGSSGEPAPLSGRVTQPSDNAGPDCVIGYAGYHQMLELGTYQVRFRVYDPELGRWFQRDPAGYVDGMSLYEYVASGPLVYIDPYGLGLWQDTMDGARELVDLLTGEALREDDEHRALIAKTTSGQLQKIRQMEASGEISECEAQELSRQVRNNQEEYNQELTEIRESEYKQVITTLEAAVDTAAGALIPGGAAKGGTTLVAGFNSAARGAYSASGKKVFPTAVNTLKGIRTRGHGRGGRTKWAKDDSVNLKEEQERWLRRRAEELGPGSLSRSIVEGQITNAGRSPNNPQLRKLLDTLF